MRSLRLVCSRSSGEDLGVPVVIASAVCDPLQLGLVFLQLSPGIDRTVDASTTATRRRPAGSSALRREHVNLPGLLSPPVG
jgi:hypothetical protein